MDQTLLTLPLFTRRDALVARQRARQIAGILGFDFQEQACIAAGVFAVAWQVLALRTPVNLCFVLTGETFKVFVSGLRPRKKDQASGVSLLHLEKKVPAPCNLSQEDVAWAVQHLHQLTSGWMVEEVQRMNQELLATLHALHTCQVRLSQVDEGKSAAA
jgi:hypothetical protein